MSALSAEPSTQPKLAIVVPCYNEEAVLEITAGVLLEKINSLIAKGIITEQSHVLFVDDGSRDDTWRLIEQLHEQEPNTFHGVKLAHNKGHQNALFAGLMTAREAKVDCAVSMDADLQDDPNAIDKMLEEYKQGAQIVYGVRDNRETDTAFKRGTARAFYKLMSAMGTETIPDHADFRLMSLCALDALSQYREVNLFLRGIVPSLGFKTAKVFYKRGTRAAGESKYPLKKMISFALDGITSFSKKPLSIITGMGMASVIIGIVMFIYTLVSVFSGHSVAGWGSIMCSIWILGGMLLTSLGVVGTYIGKIYEEVKDRPRYILEKKI